MQKEDDPQQFSCRGGHEKVFMSEAVLMSELEGEVNFFSHAFGTEGVV